MKSNYVSSTKDSYANALPVEILKLFLEFIPKENHKRIMDLLPELLFGSPVILPHELISLVAFKTKKLREQIYEPHPSDVEVIKASKREFQIISLNKNNNLDEIKA